MTMRLNRLKCREMTFMLSLAAAIAGCGSKDLETQVMPIGKPTNAPRPLTKSHRSATGAYDSDNQQPGWKQ